MSSLKPLFTMTLLAIAGAFLYMKINETEPVLPAELADQSYGLEVEVGESAASTAPQPPSFDDGAAGKPGSTAPPFAAAADAAKSGGAAASGSAPAWKPDALVVEPAAVSTAAKSSAASTAPEMPPLPPPTNSAATTPATKAPPADSSQKTAATAAAMGAVAGAAAASATKDSSQAPSFEESPVTPEDPYAAAPTTQPSAGAKPSDAASSMFGAARIAVQGALDRGELAQALLLLSDWYGDPSLSAAEKQEVETLLGQLAGSVIYEGPPAHRLEPAYIVQTGDTLEAVAQKYQVPAALLAKINGVAESAPLEAGQELKVVRGPFSALVDLSERRMTLMLDRRYAGKFDLDLDPTVSVEEGQWKVDQKLLTPSSANLYGQPPGASSEERSILLSSSSPNGAVAVLRGPGGGGATLATDPVGRVLRLSSQDVGDVFDILSVGSRVTIRR